MKTEEFVSALSEISERNVYKFEQVRASIPLGMDEAGTVVVAHREENAARYFHVCVTGENGTAYTAQLALTLACLYEKSAASFLILSPHEKYGELLRLKNADFTVPYLRSVGDLENALATLKEIRQFKTTNAGCPKHFVVLDGLEELPDAENSGALTAYRRFFEELGGSGVEIISRVDLSKSIYAGYFGAFAGIGNCIVTPKGAGKADVVFVENDSTLSVPREVDCPDGEPLKDVVDRFNALT